MAEIRRSRSTTHYSYYVLGGSMSTRNTTGNSNRIRTKSKMNIMSSNRTNDHNGDNTKQIVVLTISLLTLNY